MRQLRQNIRQNIRRERRALSCTEQEHASRSLLGVLCRLASYRYAQRLSFYLPSDGEIRPDKLMHQAIARGKTCYLPVIHPLQENRLHFVQYQATTPLVKNRFGIQEPRLSNSKTSPPWALNIIFLPLVAFDRSGTRLGMGGGYYDRTLASCCTTTSTKPLLIGLAHSCQEVDKLPRSPWDVPMSLIATEKELIVANQPQTKEPA